MDLFPRLRIRFIVRARSGETFLNRPSGSFWRRSLSTVASPENWRPPNESFVRARRHPALLLCSILPPLALSFSRNPL